MMNPRSPGLLDGLALAAGVAAAMVTVPWGSAIAAPGGLEPWLLVFALGVVAGAPPGRRVSASVESDTEGKPRVFSLALGTERTVLEPGRTWTQVDHFKWVTRGVIEVPQSFAIHADGSVDLNGESFRPIDPEGAHGLEEQINKRHGGPSSQKPRSAAPAQPAPPPSTRVQFRVRLDSLGHLQVEARRGTERTETGLRGLSHLAVDGWMKPPGALRVDPLQRYVEMDGIRYETTSEGARDLELQLNGRYAAEMNTDREMAIEIRENPAAATGFDIHFWTVRAGARFEVKGHLSQEKLDILQDHDKCDLLQPGILIRLAPPFLYIRRRRQDGGEEHLPDLPDIKYRAITATNLQRLLNDPRIRSRTPAAGPADAGQDSLPADIASVQVRRRRDDLHLLWLELGRLHGKPVERALTHHNLTQLKTGGFFRDGWEITLSLDNRELVIRQPDLGIDERLAVEVGTSDAVLSRAGERLTAALRAPSPVVVPLPDVDASQDSTPQLAPTAALDRSGAQPACLSSPQAAPAPAGDLSLQRPDTPRASPLPPEVAGHSTEDSTAPMDAACPQEPETPRIGVETDLQPTLFAGHDPHRINEAIFEQLGNCLNLPKQDLLLSLPRIFEDRRFEILSFNQEEIASVFELRGDHFYGFYLTHLGPERVDLVYACCGLHLEWGAGKCAIQPGPGAETQEWPGSGLLGLAQDAEHHFIFLVEPRCRAWLRPHEEVCSAAFAHFRTPEEWARNAEAYALIWPVPP